jgi:hypothetical protein
MSVSTLSTVDIIEFNSFVTTIYSRSQKKISANEMILKIILRFVNPIRCSDTGTTYSFNEKELADLICNTYWDNFDCENRIKPISYYNFYDFQSYIITLIDNEKHNFVFGFKWNTSSGNVILYIDHFNNF